MSAEMSVLFSNETVTKCWGWKCASKEIQSSLSSKADLSSYVRGQELVGSRSISEGIAFT